MEKIFSTVAGLRKAYGAPLADRIWARKAVLEKAAYLGRVSKEKPVRCHQLTEDRKGQFAVSLNRNMRLVFEPRHDPLPQKADGGIDLEQVTEIEILEVIDYHQ